MQINVAVVNAFVDGAADTGAAMNGAALENTIGGNPAGVVLEKSGTQITSLSAGGRGVLSRMLKIEIDATL